MLSTEWDSLYLKCAAGNMLIIGENLVVEISRSPKLDIDL